MPFSFENGFLSGQYTKKYSCRQIVTYRQVSGGIFYAIFSYFSDSLLGIHRYGSDGFEDYQSIYGETMKRVEKPNSECERRYYNKEWEREKGR